MKKIVLFVGIFVAVLAVLFLVQQDKVGQSPFVALPVQFTSSNIPYIEIEIDGKKCHAKIDLGSDAECALRAEVLHNIPKEFLRKLEWIDMKGHIYESDEYLISSIKMKSAKISNLKAITENEKFDEEGSHLSGPPETTFTGDKIDGRIGWKLLQGMHPFFDFKNSRFYITRGHKSLTHFKKLGYETERMQPAPFEVCPFGCIIQVDTNYGPKRFLLDTAASKNFVKPSKFENIDETILFTKFSIGKQNFNSVQAHLFEFSDQYENIDGILGMSFFEKNIVLLDFTTHQIWIGLEH